ncbi:MAG: Na+/H+ antiporter subunit A [Propionibacterium sp.]|nr:Na+/H+ antiporter subunit A [Propionibacterium sp.]
MIVLLAAHLVAALAAPLMVRLLGRRALALVALVPASAAVWAALGTTAAFSGTPATQHLRWIPGLDMDLWFRLDPLSWLMTLIVGGVGALVLVYASAYFSDSSTGLGRFAAVFVGFAGAMLGVVTVDHSMGLYLFWEATSLLSFLLIGHHHDRRPARAAARQALLVTSSGSLAMFAGFVILGLAPGGSFRLSELVHALATGTMGATSAPVVIASLLVLMGAATKSALVPAHFWLPGAMAAPTPVSAYLHAAAMVKAGVYLVARMSPGLTEVPGWSPVVLTLGLATMVVGGWRALRQHDLKLVLAYGTVSQLGLITAAVGQGSAGALAAGLTMLVAHSLFKSTLFLTVGAVESATGTRDMRRLSGLGRRVPLLAGAAGVAALSMAGVPLTTGYLGKEALLATLLHGSEADWVSRLGGVDLVVALVVAAGSALTVAYSWRAWWGAFGTREVAQCPIVRPLTPTMVAPVLLLSLGALLGLAPHTLESVLAPATRALPGSAHLAWWSGWEPALLTAVVLAGGVLLARFASRFEAFQSRVAQSVSAVDVYSWSLRELEILSTRLTRLTQQGSLPWNLSTIMLTLVAAVAVSVTLSPPTTVVVRWSDSPLQVGIAVLIVIAAVLTARSRRRMRAVFALGAVGLGVALLYASQGAPDLALTQIVVEAVGMVVFVLVMRKLPRYFSDRPLASARWLHLGIAGAVGIGVVATGLYAASARIHTPVSALMPSEALEFGGGHNIVNVILVDIRAWDTVGELSVLLVTATGVASLIYLRSRSGSIDRAPSAPEHRPFLPAVSTLRPQDRSTVLEVTTRLLFPTMLVLSVWLLLIGHNSPGGGFAGGVVAGLAFVLRYLAGGRHELGEAMPVPAGRVMGLGLFIAGAGAMLPLLFGNSVLQSTPVDIHLGVLGDLHFTTAMVLDVGVYVLVVGLVLDLVSAAGAEIDRQSAAPRRPRGVGSAPVPTADEGDAGSDPAVTEEPGGPGLSTGVGGGPR